MANDREKDENVVVQDTTDVESRYQPAKWQSNITLISCVCVPCILLPEQMLMKTVYRQFQRWISEFAGQPHECHLQASAGQ